MLELKPINVEVRLYDKKQETTNKPTNPKDAIGSLKVTPHHVPQHIEFKLSLAMLEGAIKYGSYNYRVAGVRSSIYYDALKRHMAAWWEGQEIDPDSGLPHLWKALACIAIIEDAKTNGLLTDDRPPMLRNSDWVQELNKMAASLIEKLPPAVPPYTEKTYRDTSLYHEVNPRKSETETYRDEQAEIDYHEYHR
jgi:hypothetical protein